MKLEHTPGEWTMLPCDTTGFGIHGGHTFARLGIAHVYSSTDVCPRDPQEAQANGELIALAPTAPHECSDPKCPGDANRRKLKVFDEMLEACTRMMKRLTPGYSYAQCKSDIEFIQATITKAEELTRADA